MEQRRPALDGIRAVAVLAVIAYHASSRLGGGFLGVDMFFVLSGYLITSLLLGEQGRRLGRFWARRARRLLPAVLLLVLAVALETHFREPITTYGARRDDIVATVFYYANWHFIATEQSYFALFTGQSPLQHMWSLAIEEQFYLVWPLVIAGTLLLARRRKTVLAVIVVAGAVASTVWMAAAYDPADPTAVYFSTVGRAHELLVGAGLALLVSWRPGTLASGASTRIAPPVALAAGALVVVALLLADDRSRLYYRGGSLVFAAVVAAWIWALEAAPGATAGRLLSLRPVVWIGTISYGLYLWHWPLLQWVSSTTRIADADVKRAIAVALTFAVAAASFYVVERPIRTGKVPWLRLSTPRLALVAPVVVALVLAASARATDVPDALEAASEVQRNLDAVKCPDGSPEHPPGYAWCVRRAAGAGAPVVATIGDSTSQALQPGLQVAADRGGWRFVQAGRNRCSILPLAFPNDPGDPGAVAQSRGCVGAIPKLFDEVRAREHPDVWIASDRWMLLPILQADGSVIAPGDARHDALVEKALRERVAELTSDDEQLVLLVIPPIGPPAECSTKSPPAEECEVERTSVRDEATIHARRIVERVAKESPAAVAVRVDDIVCPAGRCPAAIDGELVRYDGIHYTAAFSRRIMPEIIKRAEAHGVRFEPRRR